VPESEKRILQLATNLHSSKIILPSSRNTNIRNKVSPEYIQLRESIIHQPKTSDAAEDNLRRAFRFNPFVKNASLKRFQMAGSSILSPKSSMDTSNVGSQDTSKRGGKHLLYEKQITREMDEKIESYRRFASLIEEQYMKYERMAEEIINQIRAKAD
jgi:hypothetical protein